MSQETAPPALNELFCWNRQCAKAAAAESILTTPAEPRPLLFLKTQAVKRAVAACRQTAPPPEPPRAELFENRHRVKTGAEESRDSASTAPPDSLARLLVKRQSLNTAPRPSSRTAPPLAKELLPSKRERLRWASPWEYTAPPPNRPA